MRLTVDNMLHRQQGSPGLEASRLKRSIPHRLNLRHTIPESRP
jgi:hypothetical protein